MERSTRSGPEQEPTLRLIRELEAVAFAPGSDEKDAPVKLSSKLKALELLGKSLGIFDGTHRRDFPPVTIVEDTDDLPVPETAPTSP